MLNKSSNSMLRALVSLFSINFWSLDGQSDGFTQKLITKIIDNLQVEVKGVRGDNWIILRRTDSH